MAHVVTNKCLGCKFTDCVLVCPVACFYELEGQLVIHPEECIDCMACVDECPVHAIYAEGEVANINGSRTAGSVRASSLLQLITRKIIKPNHLSQQRFGNQKSKLRINLAS